MDAIRLTQPSDQLQQLENAINTAEVSGWDVLIAVVIVLIAYPVGKVVAKATTGAVGRIPNLPDDLVKDIGRLTKWFTYLIAVAWALSLLGVNVGWVAIVVAVVVIFGFLMAKPMVENIAAGTLLTVRPSFGVGDQVETAGYRGTVEEIGSRSTVLRTATGFVSMLPIPTSSAHRSSCTPRTTRGKLPSTFPSPMTPTSTRQPGSLSRRSPVSTACNRTRLQGCTRPASPAPASRSPSAIGIHPP